MTFLIESVETEEGTVLYKFSRDADGKKTLHLIKDFIPYFYAPENDTVPDDIRILKTERGFNAIDGRKVKKVFVKNSKTISEIRGFFTQHYEADIKFANRYIIDEIGETEIYPLRTLYIDIELDAENDFPDMELPNQAVTCISLTDSFTNKTITLFYQSPLATVKLEAQEDVTIYDSEERLLLGFVAAVKSFDPDIISGWNVEKFDFTYLIRRMKLLNVNYNLLSPLDKVWISKYGDVVIKGRVLMDGMYSYLHFRLMSNQGRAESLSLEYTAQSELGTGKLPHEENFHELWMNHPQKLVDYNKRDNELVKKIIDKYQIFDFFNQLRSKSFSQINDVFSASVLVDGALLHREHNKTVFPSRNTSGGEMFSGAFVVLPNPGVYENVLALDVKGMYPNIIKSFNVGYETLNKDGNIKLANNIRFDSGTGIIARAVISFEEERNKNKRLKKEATTKEEQQFYHFRQYAIKVLMNSIYGYLGFPKSRLYKKEVAEAVTTTGREINLWTQEFLKKKGYEVIYGDTDSVYVKAKTSTLPMLIIEGNKLVEVVNESYLEFCKERGSDNCTLEIEFEKIFKKILFVCKRGDTEAGAKKKYAYSLLWKDGKICNDNIEVSGFETVRSDVPRVARDAQREVIKRVLSGESKDSVLEYLKNVEKRVRNREFPDDEIGFPKGISEPLTSYAIVPPVVRGCLYSNKYLGTRFGKGSKPKWIYIRSVPTGFPQTNVISYDYEVPKGFEIDFELLTTRLFKSKIEPIWKSAGWGEFPNIDSTTKTLDNWGA